ncbi:VOC family protein [Anaerococcus sp. AGMB00486]|uniref:Aldoketomutase n=1 Tax=Anaerococcus faecalis TaxID=2742993 RepID=A0ABX2N844_9FIRM|nr:VOC family protein [Anaerococcus faecalis]NVF10865.1 VOC family protein [Anaerococcus faecalis]
MKFKALHTCIYTDNDKESIKFYEDALNMHITSRKDFDDDDEFSLIYMASEDEKYELELTYNHDGRKYKHGSYYGHMAFGVKNFKKAYEKHKKMGIVSQKIGSLSDGSAKFYFIKDPQGFSIEIIEE